MAQDYTLCLSNCPWSHATSLFGSPTAQWSTGNIRATRFWAGLRGCCHVLWRAWVSLQWAMLCRGWYICASPMHHSNWALAGCGTELRETGIQEVGLPGTPSKAAQCHSALQAGAAATHCGWLCTTVPSFQHPQRMEMAGEPVRQRRGRTAR